MAFENVSKAGPDLGGGSGVMDIVQKRVADGAQVGAEWCSRSCSICGKQKAGPMWNIMKNPASNESEQISSVEHQ